MSGGYSVNDVARLLDLSPTQVRGYVRAGLVDAERGPRGQYRFGFAELVVLRAAKNLQRARIPKSRIKRTLDQLRAELGDRALTGLEIRAEGDGVVVDDGERSWSPESGQAHFRFEVDALAKRVAPLARRRAREARAMPGLSADEWYDIGCDLEEPAPAEAREAYRRALELDPHHTDAHVNLGRLLHEAGEIEAAERHYRLALHTDPEDATAVFNLGVVLEDAHRLDEARAMYERALRLDAAYADACFNLATLCERAGDKTAALRYFAKYRKIIGGRDLNER